MDNTNTEVRQPPAGLTIKEQMEFKRYEQARVMRVVQFNTDLLEVLTALDPELFKVFTLRWGLSHPPGGWEDPTVIIMAMHAQRMVNIDISEADKLKSARALLAHGYKLPPGVTLNGDVLTGHVVSRMHSGGLAK